MIKLEATNAMQVIKLEATNAMQVIKLEATNAMQDKSLKIIINKINIILHVALLLV